tara:strand:- start:627607 stop:629004 length:1398 start_codon:yes stop_codon:yes gene_type:complete
MNRISCAGWILLSLCFAADANDDATGKRPNFVFLLADDLGYGDLGCYGRQDIQTPNIDRLAASGVRFTNHYANGPECSPTRVALMTGRYQQWVGGLECAIGTGNVGRYDDAIRLREANDLGLPTEERTLPRMLKEAGYATAIFGKWHLGYEPKFSPDRHGFDQTLYCIGGGMDYFHYLDNIAGYNLFSDGHPVRREGYFTDMIADEGIKYLNEYNSDKPFFLYLPFTCPHFPYQGPNDGQPNPLPLDSPLWIQNEAPPEVYIAMVEHMDKRIGDVLDTIAQQNLSEDTFVIFASDNGGSKSARNEPLSGFKGSAFEGGIRVPAIISKPNVIPAAKVCDQACITFDFTKSIVELAGASEDPKKPLEGIDIITHVMNDQPDFDRTLYWRKQRGEQVWKAVRQGNLKYVAEHNGKRQTDHLFDLAVDISEQHDLSASRSADLQRLRGKYEQWETVVRKNRRGKPSPTK